MISSLCLSMISAQTLRVCREGKPVPTFPDHALAVSFQEVVHSTLTGNSEVAKHQRFAENRMDTHKNAPMTPKGREAMVRFVVDGGLSKAAAARQFNTTPKTVAKWVARFRAEGVDGLRDRSSRPHSLPSQTAPATSAAIATLRRQRHTGKQIAAEVGVSPATVSRILRRLGLNRIRDLEPVEPVRRYEREKPGEMIHIDIKKLGRINGVGHRITGDRRGQSNLRARGQGPGWEYVHVCIDDHSRIAFAQVLPNERKQSAIRFLKAALAHYASLGISVERVMTDNGSCYKSFAFRRACKRLGLKHIRTRPYTPKTNGKAERFIQTSLREWAYARAYQHSRQRREQLAPWLHRYNWHRPHAGIGAKTPISRLRITEDNLLRLHI
jgi:transposase InsO family protein/DNA-binding transcriptional regulator YiaG